MMVPILQVRGLQKRYGGALVVDDVSLDLPAGEVLTLLGPSGCGKSTTLRLVAGLEEPDAGEIIVRGRTVASVGKHLFVSAEKRNMGLVFQSYAVWPHLTVAQNVAYPLEIRRMSRSHVQAKVDEVLDLVGLTGYGGRPATNLSGGQQQRVSLARALAYEPDILLLDEPLSNLDAKLREEMRVQLKALQQRLGTTLLYVTHDQVEAMSLSHQVAVMDRGRIAQIGPPAEIYESPRTYFVQSFVGRTVTFEGVVEHANGTARVRLDDVNAIALEEANTLAEGVRVRLAIRPEDVSLETAGMPTGVSALKARLQDLIYCGDHFECALRVGRLDLLMNAPKDVRLRRGDEVYLTFDRSKVRTWPL